MERLKKVKTIYSGFAISLIVLGAVLLIRPTMTGELFCRICGALLALFGIVKVFGYFSRDLLQLAFQFDFAMGIISGLIGCSMFFWAEKLKGGWITIIGLFMLADALFRIQTAFDAKKIGLEKWWIIILVALITIVSAALLFFQPFQGAKTVEMLIGLNLVIDGILNLYVVQSTVTTIRRREKWQV